MKPLEEQNKKILSRWSVFDLREFSDEEIGAGQKKYGDGAFNNLRVTESGTSPNLIEWYSVRSGVNLYQVRKFFNFVFCECPGFNYHRQLCKHILFVFPMKCGTCGKNIGYVGDCEKCEIENAVYLIQTPDRPAEKIGNIRI